MCRIGAALLSSASGPTRGLAGDPELVGIPAVTPTDAAAKSYILLLKMGLQDDPKAFVDLFEHVAKATLQ